MSKPSPSEAKQPRLLLERISKTFPDLKWNEYKFIDEGWDHQIIILDGRTVFRFPNDAEYASKLRLEAEVLAYLNGMNLPVLIPDYTYKPSTPAFVGYNLIPGKNVTKQYFDELSPNGVNLICSQLAGFLSTIHNLKTSRSPLNKLSGDPLKEDQLEVREGVDAYLVSVLSKEDLHIVFQILEEVDDLASSSLPKAFIHNDIYSRHLFWDGSAEQLGIIDFSDMGIGDPSIDFAELHEYGFGFVNKVYEQYEGPRDPAFLERAWTYQKWIGVYMMVDHFINHKTTFEVARETFDRVKEQEKVRTSKVF